MRRNPTFGLSHSPLATLRELLENGSLRLLAGSARHLAGSAAQEAIRRNLTPTETVVHDLLITGGRRSHQDAGDALGADCLDALVTAGILAVDQDWVCFNGFRLHFLGKLSILAGGNPEMDQYVHLGPDTMALLEKITWLRAGKTGLDLCAGSGILALRLAERCDQVVAVELLPQVCEVARLNIALNAAEAQVSIQEGDLWEPVRGRRFDCIVANPPFSAALQDDVPDAAANAGFDGLDHARAIWNGARDHLSPGGVLMMIVGLLGSAEAVFAEAELARLARSDGLAIEMLACEPPRPISGIHISTVQKEPVLRRLDQIKAGAARLGATHSHIVVLRLRVSSSPGFDRLNLAESYGDAYRNRALARRARKT